MSDETSGLHHLILAVPGSFRMLVSAVTRHMHDRFRTVDGIFRRWTAQVTSVDGGPVGQRGAGGGCGSGADGLMDVRFFRSHRGWIKGVRD